MNGFFLVAELVLIVAGVVLGIMWARYPQGNYEPFTLLVGLGVGLIEFFRRRRSESQHERQDVTDDSVILIVGEEAVTFSELLRSLPHDVVKINAHSHALGVAAEYEWIRRRYPHSDRLEQGVTTLGLIQGEETYKADQIHFDVIRIRLADGREKTIYFDISSFFGGGISSALDPGAAIARKLAELYRINPRA